MSAQVLVVEDNPFVRGALIELLMGEGYGVCQAADGLEAIAILRAQPAVGLVVLDWRMPGAGASGLAFRQWQLAQPRWRTLPTVVLSGDVDAIAELEAVQGCVLMAKPIELAALLAAVRDQLAPQRL